MPHRLFTPPCCSQVTFLQTIWAVEQALPRIHRQLNPQTRQRLRHQPLLRQPLLHQPLLHQPLLHQLLLHQPLQHRPLRL
jgi:hypothetical protein